MYFSFFLEHLKNIDIEHYLCRLISIKLTQQLNIFVSYKKLILRFISLNLLDYFISY